MENLLYEEPVVSYPVCEEHQLPLGLPGTVFEAMQLAPHKMEVRAEQFIKITIKNRRVTLV